MLFRIVLLGLLFFTTASFAQKKRKQAKAKTESSSVEPYYPEEGKYMPSKKKGKRKGNITYNAQSESKSQREALAKQRRQAERELAKPKNTNPAYFGHKRMPKKRPPEKMKFCKVCLIRH